MGPPSPEPGALAPARGVCCQRVRGLVREQPRDGPRALHRVAESPQRDLAGHELRPLLRRAGRELLERALKHGGAVRTGAQTLSRTRCAACSSAAVLASHGPGALAAAFLESSSVPLCPCLRPGWPPALAARRSDRRVLATCRSFAPWRLSTDPRCLPLPSSCPGGLHHPKSARAARAVYRPEVPLLLTCT